ncbi:MAG: hypothetical protein Q7R47_06475, partial [Candidatus Diapherotrites archaeon]|nr:hypothetical protein [Candidatus Diapherotrites archaeon]
LAELQAITQTRLINSRECLQRLRKLKATPTIEREKELLSERIGFAIEIQKLRNGIERDRLTDADFRKYLVRNLNAVVDNRRHYDFRNKEGSDNSIFLGQFLQTMGLHPSTSDLASAINVVTTDVLETRSLRRLIERTGARIRKTNRDYLAQTEELLSERIRRIQSIPRMPIAKRMELIAYAEKALKASEKE